MGESAMGGDLVITGIPRSGTSYVCALLNKMENTVIVNEPEEIFTILHNDTSGSLQEWYAHIRQCINDRVPIQNKILNGRYIEDTNTGDVRNFYTPDVSDASFVFGTKNTLVYLASLHKLHEHLPEAKIIAFVRHPYDCISSWKKVRFPHIRNATPLFLKDYADERAGEEISRICNEPELEIRYALLWSFLARRIMDYTDRLLVNRYEDFVRRPEQHLAALYSALGKSMKSRQPIVPSEPRTHGETLSDIEIQYIREYCGETASYFGYSLS